MHKQPSLHALYKLSRLSLGWSMSTTRSAFVQGAARRLHLMSKDLIGASDISPQDLMAVGVLYQSLCRKMGCADCQCSETPLLDCPELSEA